MATYKQLSQKHPDWDGPYWRRCRALYAGGRRLLKDRKLLSELMPRHLAESDRVYNERLNRAYYIPYAGEVVDMITSALFSENLSMRPDPEPDPWYAEWAQDVSPPGGQRQTIQQFLKEQVTTALLCRVAWSLLDLPRSGPEIDAPTNLKEQEDRGDLDAYAVSLDPECVWDWECAADGALLWLVVHEKTSRRAGVEGDRSRVTESWRYYDATSWRRYSVSYDGRTPPQPDDDVPVVDEATHNYGRVPVVRLELTEGMWAMGKIESIAVAHLNKRNALSWAMYKTLFPVLAHYAGAPDPLNTATDDPDRAINQAMGPGYVMQFADKDRLEYTSPDAGPFSTCQQDLKDLRDEMHRVVHQMAMSVDNSAAALGRSAESKQVDQGSTAVVLRDLAKRVKEHAVELHGVVQIVRGDESPTRWGTVGMDKYDDDTVDNVVTQAQTLEVVSIPSAKFQQIWKFQVAKRVLGDNVEEEDLDVIRDELEANISNEQFQAPPTGQASYEFGDDPAARLAAKLDEQSPR